MRVAILIDALGTGGAERQVLAAARALVSGGCEVELVHYHGSEDADGVPVSPQPPGLRITRLLREGSKLRFAWRLRRYLRGSRYDVVHAFKAVPTLYACWAGGPREGPAIMGGCRGQYAEPRLVRLAQRLTRGLVAGWIVNSRAIARSLIERLGLAQEDCFVVYNGVEPERIASRLPKADAKRRLGLDPDTPTVSIIAGLRPVKNHALFLEMARRVVERHPGARFLIVGDGELRARLESRARELNISDHVRFLGHRTDIPEILAATDVATLNSLHEGLSNSLLEAMCAGVPVVSTHYPGVEELFTDGMEGLVAPWGDAIALAEGVSDLLQSPAQRARMGEAAARSARTRFSMSGMAHALIDAYETCLRRRERTSR